MGSGIFKLLLVALLVAMPVVAFGLVQDNGFIPNDGTKIYEIEDLEFSGGVADYFSHSIDTLSFNIMELVDSDLEEDIKKSAQLGSGLYQWNKGGDWLYAGSIDPFHNNYFHLILLV